MSAEQQRQRELAARELQAAEESRSAVAVSFWSARLQYLARPQPAFGAQR